MDILIVGGLLVVGVAALVALFFVLRSGPRSTVARGVPQTSREELPTPIQPETIQPEPLHATIPSATQVQPEPVEPQAVPVVAEVQPEPVEPRTVPIAETTAQDGISQDGAAVVRSLNEKEQPLRVHLNGQFHELTTGLRDLQQQATEMEQHLRSLTQMFESIESDPPEEK